MNALNAGGLPYAAPSSSSPFSSKGSSLTSIFLAAVIPFVFLKVLAFFNHTWPNFVFRLLTSRLERQIATIEERVFPNRLIQDDIMIRSVMGYVSYCYVQTLRNDSSACDAVSMADYDYTFIYENVDSFQEDWVPYSTQYKTLLGRVIAGAMELSVLPSTGQAIQVEPGLFVRSMENKHVRGKPSEGGDAQGEGESDEASRSAKKNQKGSVQVNQMDKLNRYAFYDMRKHAENMDERAQPAADGKEDDADSLERPFDPPAQHHRDRRGRRKGKEGGDKAESTCFDDDENPRQENLIVLEYRRPLPFERAQALCTGHNTAGVATEFDDTRAAGDVMEGFLERAHGWYLGHVAQRKANPLMAIYPSPALALFTAKGVHALKERRPEEGDFSGRCYVLESASPGSDAEAAASPPHATGKEENGTGIAAAVTIGPSTLSGGFIGLDGAATAARSMGKTFDSLFFPSKARVLAVLDDFVRERGCYGVPGVVPRLNFFLHGAPGTGKTSFVKALARHIRRNLVVVSMSEIVTVGELQRLMQPFELNHTGNDADRYGSSDSDHFSVRPHQSIYVFEDFDAIGQAWSALKRDQGARKVMMEQEKKAKAAAEAAEEEKKEEDVAVDAEDASEDDAEGDGEGAGGAASASAEHSSADNDNDSNSGSDCGSDCGSDSDGDGGSSAGSSSAGSKNFLLKEEQLEELERTHLTVDRFLDLFNGFNLPDSFIAVFTTNHPELVHPRITSSNMMDVALDMGMLSDVCATEMVEHYFGNELDGEAAGVSGPTGSAGRHRHLSAAQIAEFHAALAVFNASSDGLSGALLEKMCIECDTVELLTQRLRAPDTWEMMNAF